jgi:hypothetical protein
MHWDQATMIHFYVRYIDTYNQEEEKKEKKKNRRLQDGSVSAG